MRCGRLPDLAVRQTFVGLAAVLVTVFTTSAVVPAAHAGEYYSDSYERPYAYSYYQPSYYRPSYYRPHRWGYDRPRYHCWRCGYQHYGRREPVIERRYIVREYYERRYPGSWRGYSSSPAYADEYGDVPRPPAAVPSYYDYEAAEP